MPNIGDVEFDVEADLTGFASRLRARMLAAIKRVESSLPKVDVDVDANPRKGVLTRLSAVFRKAGNDSGSAFSLGFGQSFRGQVFSDPQAAILKLLAAFAGLTAAVTPLGPLLVGLAAALGAVAGVIGSVGIAAGVAVIGMKGFFSAVKEGGSALDGLTPSARETAESIRGLSDEWSGLRRAVQESIFSQVGDSFSRLSQTITQGLQPGMVKIGASIGKIVDAFADWAGSAPGIELISTVMERVADVFERLRPGLQSFGIGFLQLFNALLPAAGDMADSFSEMGESFRDWTASLDDGQVNKVSDAIGVMARGFRDLGKVFGPVLSGLSDAFDDIGPSLDTLRSALFPILETLGKDLGDAFTLLGPVIAGVVDSFAKMLKAVEPLAPILLPVLGAILAFTAGGPVGVIAALALAFASLAAKSEPLRKGFSDFFNVVKPLIDQSLKQMRPLLEDLAKALGELGVELGPIAKALLKAFGPVVAAQIKIFFRAMSQAIKAITSLVKFAAAILRGDWSSAWRAGLNLSKFLNPFHRSLESATNRVRSMVRSVVGAFNTLRSGVNRATSAARSAVAGGFSSMARAVSSGVGRVVRIAASLPGRIRGALGNVGSLLYRSGYSMLSGLADGISAGIDRAVAVASGGLSRLRGLFPFSPAKEGPFSGRGYTTFSGKALIDDFAAAIKKAANTTQPEISRALQGTQEAVTAPLAPLTRSTPAPAPVTVNVPEQDFSSFLKALTSLRLQVNLGRDRRTTAEWWLEGQKYAETLA